MSMINDMMEAAKHFQKNPVIAKIYGSASGIACLKTMMDSAGVGEPADAHSAFVGIPVIEKDDLPANTITLHDTKGNLMQIWLCVPEEEKWRVTDVGNFLP